MTFRERESLGEVGRACYTYGMLRAADSARALGFKEITVVEFGVADGRGILAIIEVAPEIERETGVGIRIVGFDSGVGLPKPKDYRDHPEIWHEGQFPTTDREQFDHRINGRATVIWGDIAWTGLEFFAGSKLKNAPLGFAAVDVDLYSSAKHALACLMVAPDKFLPAVSLYFDDTSFFTANEWCGELLAIKEFNEIDPMRKIGADRSLPWSRRTIGPWTPGMRVLHIFDHERRRG